ncbi:MAG: hypothetical protein JEZ04_14375 [Spirochaetales bacterium]|nr:hypothetical protein [Spirochaetales bacterium]
MSDQQALRWKNFKHIVAQSMYKTLTEAVFPFIKNVHGFSGTSFAQYMKNAMFLISTEQMLEKIVTNIDSLPLLLYCPGRSALRQLKREYINT